MGNAFLIDAGGDMNGASGKQSCPAPFNGGVSDVDIDAVAATQ